ncbi:MAG TPA: transcriptional regulator [Acidimicrobiales bacterium]|jgi:transcriptional regulator with XRE-family HTH domain|nr:transcriptional regulator [Acidimicrobiales bacterium]
MTVIDSTESELDEAGRAYARLVGVRLRGIRRQKRMSLQEVERDSALEFKASVLGAYERGERAISVPRLQRLARFYRVPVSQLLPGDDGDDGAEPSETGRAPDKLILDLTKLDALATTEGALLARFLGMIQVQRQDFNGRMLTIRGDDLRAVACILNVSVDGVRTRLDEMGVAFHP